MFGNPPSATWCTQALLQALSSVGRLPSVWREAMISLQWYQDKLTDRLARIRRFNERSPEFTSPDEFTVRGLGTLISFWRKSADSPLCAKFSNGTVRSFFPVRHRNREFYSLRQLSFIRWLELMVFGWNNFEIGLVEITRNGTGFVSSIGLQCESDGAPYWFSNTRR